QRGRRDGLTFLIEDMYVLQLLQLVERNPRQQIRFGLGYCSRRIDESLHDFCSRDVALHDVLTFLICPSASTTTIAATVRMDRDIGNAVAITAAINSAPSIMLNIRDFKPARPWVRCAARMRCR